MRPSDIINSSRIVPKDDGATVWHRKRYRFGVLYWKVMWIDYSVDPPKPKYAGIPAHVVGGNAIIIDVPTD